MLVRIRKKLHKAQASLEYAALIGVVIGAIVIMSTYLRRSVEGKLRSNADDIGDQYDIESGTYNYSQNLTGSEATYTMVGANATTAGTIAGLEGGDFVIEEDIGEGSQFQWTRNTAPRETVENIDTVTGVQ